MFSKAPVRRFNEQPDSAPAPGTYDPKFLTDLQVAAKLRSLRSGISRDSSRSSRSKSSSPCPSRTGSAPKVNSFTPSRPTSSTQNPGPLVSINQRKPLQKISQCTETDDTTFSNIELKNKSLNQKITILEALYEETMANGIALEAQKADLQKRISDYELFVKKLESEKNDMTKKEFELSNSLELLKSSLRDSQTPLLNCLENGIEGQDLASYNTTISLQKRNEDLQNTILMLEEQIKNLEQQYNESEDKCNMLLENMNKCLNMSKETAEYAEEEQRNLLKELNSQKQQRQELQKTLNEEIERRIALEKKLMGSKSQENGLHNFPAPNNPISTDADNGWEEKEAKHLEETQRNHDFNLQFKQFKEHVEHLESQCEKFIEASKGDLEEQPNFRSFMHCIMDKCQRLKAFTNEVLSLVAQRDSSSLESSSSGLADDDYGVSKPSPRVSFDDSVNFTSNSDIATDWRQKIAALKAEYENMTRRRPDEEKLIQDTVSFLNMIEEENQHNRRLISHLKLGMNREKKRILVPMSLKKQLSLDDQDEVSSCGTTSVSCSNESVLNGNASIVISDELIGNKHGVSKVDRISTNKGKGGKIDKFNSMDLMYGIVPNKRESGSSFGTTGGSSCPSLAKVPEDSEI